MEKSPNGVVTVTTVWAWATETSQQETNSNRPPRVLATPLLNFMRFDISLLNILSLITWIL
jgi:hypothetical protein